MPRPLSQLLQQAELQQASSSAHVQASTSKDRRKERKSVQARPSPHVPASTEVELQRQHLIHLAQQLDEISDINTTVQAEKELLVAERGLVVQKIQAATKALLSGRPMSEVEQDACEDAEYRVSALRLKLPTTSTARLLSEHSDLFAILEGLQRQLLNLHAVWQEEAAQREREILQSEGMLSSMRTEVQQCQLQLSQAYKELEETKTELETVLQERQREADEVQGLRQQLMEAELLFAQLQEEAQSDARCLAHTASELREQLIAADARIVSMQADLNHATAEQHEQQLVHERQQQQLKECHAQQVANLKTDLANTHAAQQRELQHEIIALRQSNEEALARAERADAAKLDCLQQRQEMQSQAARKADQLAKEVAQLQEDKLNLQMVVAEAEKQLQFVQKDLQGVKKNQRLALQKYQKESEERLALGPLPTIAGAVKGRSPSPPLSPTHGTQPKKNGKPRRPWILV